MSSPNSVWSQSPEIARKQYQEMRQTYAAALEALEQVRALLDAKSYEEAAVPLEKAVKLKAKLQQAALPNVIRRELPKWDARIADYRRTIEAAGVKLPDFPAYDTKVAPPARSDPEDGDNRVQHRVTIACSESGLVERRTLLVMHYPDKPVPMQSEARLKDNKAVFSDDGSCTVDLPAGTYSFHVRYTRGSAPRISCSFRSASGRV